MPSGKRKISLEAFLTEDDNDDDDIILFQPFAANARANSATKPFPDGTSNASAVSPSESKGKDETPVLTQDETPLSTQDELNALARAEAQKSVRNAQALYQEITDVSLLRWHRSGKAGKPFPCFIRPNDMGQNHEHLQVKKPTDTIVTYIGRLHADTFQHGRVSRNQLEPYDGKEGDKSAWSSSCIQKYLNAIKRQASYKEGAPQGEINLLVEKYLLEELLVYVQARSQHIQQQQNEQALESTSEQDDGEQEDSNNTGHEVQQGLTPPSPLVRSPPPPVQEEQSVLSPVNQIRVLRAGDVIKYYPPAALASAKSLCVATVAAVHKANSSESLHGTAVFLQNGQCLSRDREIKVIQRVVQGKLRDVKKSDFMEISQFRLDDSCNNIMQGQRTAAIDRAKRARRDMKADVEITFLHLHQNTPAKDKKRTPITGSVKRKRGRALA